MKTGSHAVTVLRGITVTVALSLIPIPSLWADTPQVAAPPPSMAVVQSTYGHLPLSFEANQGQVNPQMQFLTRGPGHQLFLTPSEAVLTWRTGETKGEGREETIHQGKPSMSPHSPSQAVVRMSFKDANPQA